MFVDDITKVGKRVTRTRNKASGILETKTVENVARVLLPKLGREGLAVDLVKHKEDIVSVVVQYTDAAPGDVVAQRCIAEGERRQHHVDEVIVLTETEETETETEKVGS